MTQMQFSAEHRTEIQARMNRAKEQGLLAFSADGKALLVDGGIGYGCFVSPTGDVFLETYDIGSSEPSVIDRSRKAQISVLVVGARTIPKLAELLPVRPPEASDCNNCCGSGWLHREVLSGRGILCETCSGLGWIEQL